MPAPRKRLRRYEVPGEARYLTFSCYRRLPLLNNDQIKTLFVDELAAVRTRFAFALYAYVLMPEHVHVLLLPDLPAHPVHDLLHELKRRVAEQVLVRWKALNAPILRRVTDAGGHPHYWQVGGGYDRNTRSRRDLFEKIDYIHANPIRRGLVKRAEDYPWSSARWYADGTGPMPMDSVQL